MKNTHILLHLQPKRSSIRKLQEIIIPILIKIKDLVILQTTHKIYKYILLLGPVIESKWFQKKKSNSNRGQIPIFKNNNTELLLTIMYNTPSEIEFYTHNHQQEHIDHQLVLFRDILLTCFLFFKVSRNTKNF